MSRWKCGNCGKEFATMELLGLKQVPLNPSHAAPLTRQDCTVQCWCGYTFQRDRWQIKDVVSITTPAGATSVTVTTSFLEYSWNDDGCWFETVIHTDHRLIVCHQCWRYPTKDEAEAGHHQVVEALKAGRLALTPPLTKWELRLTNDNLGGEVVAQQHQPPQTPNSQNDWLLASQCYKDLVASGIVPHYVAFWRWIKQFCQWRKDNGKIVVPASDWHTLKAKLLSGWRPSYPKRYRPKRRRPKRPLMTAKTP
jgi:hypothetical protein